MNEDRSRIKTGLLLITYAVLLLAVLFNLDAVLGFIGYVTALLSPFLYAIAIAYILNILLKLFEKLFSFMERSKSLMIRKIKRPLSIMSVFISLALLFYILMVFAVPQLSSSVASFASNINNYVKSFEDFLNTTAKQLGLMGGFWNTISLNWNEIIGKAGTFISDTFPQVFAFTRNLTAFIANMATGIVISVYLLASKEKLLLILRKLIYAFMPRRAANKTIDTGIMANRVFSGYISGLIINAVIVGILSFSGILILGIPYAFLLSMIIGVTALIPILGQIIGFIMGVIIVLLVIPSKALIFAIVIFIIQQIDGNLIYPKVVGNSIGLSGPWILFALILGGTLFGFVGMVAGIPAFAVIYTLVRQVTNRRLEKKEMRIG